MIGASLDFAILVEVVAEYCVYVELYHLLEAFELEFESESCKLYLYLQHPKTYENQENFEPLSPPWFESLEVENLVTIQQSRKVLKSLI